MSGAGLSDGDPVTRPRDEDDFDADDLDPATLRAHVELLREENERLRQEYRRAKQAKYRRTAIGLLGIGLLAGAAGVVFPAVRMVLIVLSGIGLFSGLLTYYLTPERILSASITESVVTSHAATIRALVTELELQEDRLYIPVDEPETGAKLYRPRHADYAVPDSTDLDQLFVLTDVEDERGIALQPTGDTLYREFKRATTASLEPATIAETLSDGLVEQFELASSATVDRSTGRATCEVKDVALNGVEQPDHPIASFLATGLAATLETPVRIASIRVDENDATLTLTWDAGNRATPAR